MTNIELLFFPMVGNRKLAMTTLDKTDLNKKGSALLYPTFEMFIIKSLYLGERISLQG